VEIRSEELLLSMRPRISRTARQAKIGWIKRSVMTSTSLRPGGAASTTITLVRAKASNGGEMIQSVENTTAS